jgi:hypothetical protein
MRRLAVLLLCAGAAFAQTNSLTITNLSASTQTNLPIQIARPFVLGEISQYPQVLIAGTPVTTQADVKQRYGDSSVKHPFNQWQC